MAFMAGFSKGFAGTAEMLQEARLKQQQIKIMQKEEARKQKELEQSILNDILKQGDLYRSATPGQPETRGIESNIPYNGITSPKLQITPNLGAQKAYQATGRTIPPPPTTTTFKPTTMIGARPEIPATPERTATPTELSQFAQTKAETGIFPPGYEIKKPTPQRFLLDRSTGKYYTGEFKPENEISAISIPQGSKIEYLSIPGGSGIGGLKGGTSATWEEATPEQKRLAEKIVIGDLDLSSFRYDKDKMTTLANESAYRQGVPFDSYLAKERYNTMKEFKIGPTSKNIRSLNTAIYHVDTLKQAVDKMNPGSIPLLNKAILEGKKQTGDPTVNNVLIAINAVAGEVASVFKGGQASATEEEQKAWKTTLVVNQSKDQWVGASDTIVGLLGGRFQAIKGQWNRAFEGTNRKFKILDDTSTKILEKYGYDVETMGKKETTKTRPPDKPGAILLQDKNGNYAYQYTNGKIEEVK